MGLRHKSIRLRVILLVLIPVVSLIGVYAYATSTTVRTAVDLVSGRDRLRRDGHANQQPGERDRRGAQPRRRLPGAPDPGGNSPSSTKQAGALTNPADLKTFEGVSRGPARSRRMPRPSRSPRSRR